jgi:hypothetical protein
MKTSRKASRLRLVLTAPRPARQVGRQRPGRDPPSRLTAGSSASTTLATSVIHPARHSVHDVPSEAISSRRRLDTVSRPLDLLLGALIRLDARRDGSEWFVFNRRGLRKASDLTGWVTEETTPLLRDRPGAGVGRREHTLRRRAVHALGIQGRSAATRARPLAAATLGQTVSGLSPRRRSHTPGNQWPAQCDRASLVTHEDAGRMEWGQVRLD